MFGNNDLKDLVAKDISLNWKEPQSQRGVFLSERKYDKTYLHLFKKFKDDKKNRKYNNVGIKFNRGVLNEYFQYDDHINEDIRKRQAELENEDEKKLIKERNIDLVMKVSFNFDEKSGKLIMVFNPKSGVPFYKLSKGDTGTRYVFNRDLVEEIYKFYKLDMNKENYLLKIHHFTHYAGMDLKIITPHNIDKEPIFEWEKDGNLLKQI